MDFSEKTEQEWIAEYASAKEENDMAQVTALQDEAFARLKAYLAGELPVAEDESPLFFSFIKAFSKTDNVDLNMSAKKAEAKITPLLKEFDKTVGLDRLADLSAEKVEENIADSYADKRAATRDGHKNSQSIMLGTSLTPKGFRAVRKNDFNIIRTAEDFRK